MKQSEQGSTFKMLATLFLEFNHETQLGRSQLNTMQTVCNMLNAVDKNRTLNGGNDYKVVAQLDESESNPFYEVDLPDAPENPMPRKTETEKPRPSKRMAQVDLDNYNLDVMPESINFLASDEIVLGGSLNFKENVPMSKKLEWCERKLLA